ncbi:MAG TPA: hypothetical protein VFS43_27775 [Polyangiaceae bacterium]|nr:hypothetical protein [Polyangiaceae bacterium]
MRADPPSKRLVWPALLGAALLGALTFVALRPRGDGAPASASAASAPAPAPTRAPTGQTPAPPAPGGPADDAPPPAPGAAAVVDLDKLRAKLPDNAYWRLGAPTKDPDVVRARVDDERRRNELYGKVLSNTASEEEIRGYYAERRKISEDYIEFAATALNDYGDRLPDQERGLYELSIKMHTKRLGELPGQIDDALARKKVQDRRREEWRQGAPD